MRFRSSSQPSEEAPGFSRGEEVIFFLVLEGISYKIAQHDDQLVGYERRDTSTSLAMGLGSVVIGAAWGLVVIVLYAALYTVSPLRMNAGDAWT